MSSPTARRIIFCFMFVPLLLLFIAPASGQSTGGRIIGRVSDSTGAVVNGVNVKLINTATGVARQATTNDAGDYTFIEVVPGNYRVEYTLQGFKTNVRDNVTLEVNQVMTLNATLQPGGAQEVVEVTSEAPLVDTTSTQMGAAVDNRSVNELPLNTRDTYQFLQLQPGVMSTVGSSNSIYYGSNNAGSVSVNGGRGRSNNFSVNGGDANDQFVNLPTVQPTPDSIQEFRVLTNTFDAEYGRNSGSVVNVITKSGTNAVHGNVYEYFRNKVLNAQGYLNSVKPDEKQNQFGGTLGGPIQKDRTFFFLSYEGRRIRQGIPSPVVLVPNPAERPSASQLFGDYTGAGGFGGTLTDPFVAQSLSSRSTCANDVAAQGGAPIAVGNSWGATTGGPGIFTVTQSNPLGSPVGDTVIPLSCMDPTAVDLLQFVPNSANGTVQTVPVQPDRGDQFTAKVDHRLNEKQNLSIYYYFDDHSVLQPFANFQLAGANVPGFGASVKERFQQWNITHTWTLRNNSVNEIRLNYNREGQRTFQHPQRTAVLQQSCPTAPAWLTNVVGAIPCFSDGTAGNATGIHPDLGPNHEGLPFIQLSGGFNIGNNAEGELPQVGNSYQLEDSFTWVTGNHTFKFGGDIRHARFDQTLYFDINGEFFYFGGGSNDLITGDGDLFGNFLLGLPDQYTQGSPQTENVRSYSTYVFGQDSWKIRRNLTLNYGLRWEFNSPIADVSHRVQTFRPGQNSTVYPCDPAVTAIESCPTGLVVPGDKGVPAGLTQSYYKSFAPRLGIAWSPGDSGKTSIRAGWGLFYNPVEQLVLEQFSAEPPFGGSSTISAIMFNTPFVFQADGSTAPNVFHGFLNPTKGVDPGWANFDPIVLFGQFQPHMRSQYSAQYNFGIQRELNPGTKLQVAYVGTQGHRLLATHDINYGNPQTCLDLNNLSNLTGDSSLSCGPFFADSSFTIAAGEIPSGFTLHLPYGPQATVTGPNPQPITLVGLRKYSSPHCDPLTGVGCPTSGTPVFGSIFAQDTIANSAYNSLQVSLERRFTQGLQGQIAYTWSKSIDEASSFEGILNPINPRASRALSLFDASQRIVSSFYWQPPIPKYSGFKGGFLSGWAASGIVVFQTGFPIRITSQADNELMNSFDFELPGEPDLIAPFHTQRAQGNGRYFFNPNSFTENATNNAVAPCSAGAVFGCFDPSLFGRIGSAPRTICCGPHISNTDISLLKDFHLNESKYFEFRADLFNIFNHTQFLNPDGNSTDGTQFGQVTQERDPRLVQFALKFYF